MAFLISHGLYYFLIIILLACLSIVALFYQRQQLRVNLCFNHGLQEINSHIRHKIGNILNSVNVSSSLMEEVISNSEHAGMVEMMRHVEKYQPNIEEFFKADAYGKTFPNYLSLFTQAWKSEQESLSKEITLLSNNIYQIKRMVLIQQTLQGMLDKETVISLPTIIEDALLLSEVFFFANPIVIKTDFVPTQPVHIDKGRVFSILLNLINNAKESLLASTRADKLLQVNLVVEGKKCLITVTDNGIGFPKHISDKLFNYKFSTKKDAKGFGLWCNYLTAKSLGGKLMGESAGSNQGATFILQLPYVIGS